MHELSISYFPELQNTISDTSFDFQSLQPPNINPRLTSESIDSSSMGPIVSQTPGPIVSQTPGPIVSSRSDDVEKMIQTIKRHMENFDIVSKVKPIASANTLVIPTSNGVNEISVKCLISYMSGNPNYLEKDRRDCSSVFSSYLTDDMVDLTKLISLSTNDSIIKDVNFYNNLYGFCMELIRFITTEEFDRADTVTRYNVANGIYAFIDQTVKYLSNAVNTHNILDMKMTASALDLIYLQNLLNIQRVSVNTSPQDLFRTYDIFMETVKANIEAFNELMTTVQPSDLTPIADPELVAIQRDLELKVEQLKKEHTILKTLLSEAEANKTAIVSRASNQAKELARSLENKITAIV